MSISKEKLPSISLSYKKNSNDSFSHQDEKKALERVKIFFEKGLIIISMGEKIPSILLDDIFDTAIDRLISAYSQSEEIIDTNMPKDVDAIRYMVAKKVTKILLGDSFSVESISSSNNPVNVSLQKQASIAPDSTENILQSRQCLEPEYTQEQIAEMRKLRSEIEEVISKIVDIDNYENSELTDDDRQRLKQQVLQHYGIPKYRGRKLDGNPIDFIKLAYGRFIEAKVIFKSDVRKLDKELVGLINKDVHDKVDQDPLLPRSRYTELVASGILADGHEMLLAKTMIAKRSSHKEYQRLHSYN